MTIIENNESVAEELQQVETQLQPYKVQVLFAQSVLTGERPIHFGVLMLIANVLYWYFHSTSMTVIQLIGVALLTVSIGSVVLGLVDTHVTKLDKFFEPLPSKQPRPLGTAAKYIVHVRHFVDGFKCGLCGCGDSSASPLAKKAKLFFYGLLAYYCGGWLSGCTLFFLALNALLLTPFIIANDHHVVAIAAAKPHLQKLDDVVGTKIRMVLDKVNGFVGGAAPKKVAAPAAAPSSPKKKAKDSDSESEPAERSTPTSEEFEKVESED